MGDTITSVLAQGQWDDRSTWHLGPVQYGNLKHLGLIASEEELSVPRTASIDAHALKIVMGHTPKESCYLTGLGMAFVNACMPPKPEKET